MEVTALTEPKPVILQPTIYSIGKYLFQLGGHDHSKLTELSQVFVPFESSWAKDKCQSDATFTPVPDAINVDRLQQLYEARPWEIPSIGYAIWVIVDKAQDHHIQFFPWQLAFEAALLVTPSGKPVWLSGGTQAGKTTLTVSLALGLGWKIVSEDFVYIDNGCPVPFVAPLSLRPTAPSLIEEATGKSPRSVVANRWLVRPDLFDKNFHSVTEDAIAIHLSLKPGEDSSLQLNEISWTQYLRTILPISNAPKVPDGYDQLARLFETAKCLRLQNGSVSERLELLSKV